MAEFKTYITPRGFKRLRDEHRYLRLVERPKIVDEVAYAAARGDRSENAEYIYGKKRLREIDARLRQLARRLDPLTVVPPGDVPVDRVYLGARVPLRHGAAVPDLRYRLAAPDDPAVARRPDARGVRADEVCLQLRQVIRRDHRARLLAESGGDPVDRPALANDATDHGVGRLERRARVRAHRRARRLPAGPA